MPSALKASSTASEFVLSQIEYVEAIDTPTRHFVPKSTGGNTDRLMGGKYSLSLADVL